MGVSKIIYDGVGIDLTQDTAVESDVASGKTFHLANGVKTTGTNTGGITPTGTINISANGDVDVTSYATAHVAVPDAEAEFAFASTITITLDNVLDSDTSLNLGVRYRGFDPLDPSKVIWKTQIYHFDDDTPTVTHTLYLTPYDAFGILKDGIYVPVGDSGTIYNITSAVNCAPRFLVDNGETGTEHVYVTIHAATASFVVYVDGI